VSQIASASEITAEWARQREIEHHFLNETGSTNDDAKARALQEGSDVALYLTEHQTSGRGRGVHTWLDTGAGESLLSTWSFAIDSAPQAITGPRIGLALFQAARKTWPSLGWGLRAPNDLYLDGLKIAGLLVETVSLGGAHRLVIGLGFNVINHPRKLEATHLTAGLGRGLEEGEWFQFLDELLAQFTSALSEIIVGHLTGPVCSELKNALNANSAKAFTVLEVTPEGGLRHSGGMVKWTEL